MKNISFNTEIAIAAAAASAAVVADVMSYIEMQTTYEFYKAGWCWEGWQKRYTFRLEFNGKLIAREYVYYNRQQGILPRSGRFNTGGGSHRAYVALLRAAVAHAAAQGIDLLASYTHPDHLAKLFRAQAQTLLAAA